MSRPGQVTPDSWYTVYELRDSTNVAHAYRLVERDLGIIRIPSLIDPAQAETLRNIADAGNLGRYDPERYERPAFRFGPTLNENRHGGRLGRNYWDVADEAEKTWASQQSWFAFRQAILAKLSLSLGLTITPASHAGRQLYWGILRELNAGTLIHWDDVTKEYGPDFLDTTLVGQLAVNVFASAPEHGGALQIWPLAPTGVHDQFRVDYGYRDDVVGTVADLSLVPAECDAIIFSSRLMHRVLPCTGGRRLAFAMFLGLTSQGSGVVWS
jgi:hypothetical protein